MKTLEDNNIEQLKSKFRALLYNIIQIDQNELNFGIYKIIRARNLQIKDFIEYELFTNFKTLWEKIKDFTDLSQESLFIIVFNRLYTFFFRYFQDGEFIPLHYHSKSSKYLIPYNGQEYFFYWVHQNQYYIKSTPFFRYYHFTLDDWSYTLILNANYSHINRFAPHFFILDQQKSIKIENETKKITISFNIQTLNEEELKKYPSKNKQNIINEEIYEKISQATAIIINKDRILWHLNNFSKPNKKDFFIHKHLREFLLQERDAYIKNELFPFENIEEIDQIVKNTSKIGIQIYLFHQISQKIIFFLAQIEDFQKKLWEKKKFILKTHYLFHIGLVPKEKYILILQNQAQIKDWEETLRFKNLTQSISPDFLEKHPLLVIDTKYFDPQVKYEILGSFDDINSLITGFLIKSEAFQALNLLQSKFKEKVGCIYLDPPYNTGQDEFLYQDQYQHSSWLTMMANLISFFPIMGKENLNYFLSIDDHEYTQLVTLLEGYLGKETLLGPIVVQVNKGGRDYLTIAKTHEYLICGSLDIENNTFNEIDKEHTLRQYVDSKGPFVIRELRNRNPRFSRDNRPNLFYPIYIDPSTQNKDGFCAIHLETTPTHVVKTEPLNQKGLSSCWRWGKTRVLEYNNPINPDQSEIIAKQKTDGNWNIYEKYRKETAKAKSLWDESEMRTENGTIELRKLFGTCPFDHPKPVELIEKCLQLGASENDLILDFFAGSGTTGHAVLKQNFEKNKHLKFILVEMGDHFENILIPRIKKILYSLDWDEGIPQHSEKSLPFQLIQYQYLEQYEDSLENLSFIDPSPKENPIHDYFMSYMIENDSRFSFSRMNLDGFTDPFHYSLKIIDSSGITQQNVDLVETFNYLLGITVKKLLVKLDNTIEYRIVLGDLNRKRILIIWRSTKNLDLKRDKSFIETQILPYYSFTKLYLNGQSFVKDCEFIEPIFKKLMEGDS